MGDLLDLPIDEFSIEGPTVFLVTGCVWTSTGLSLELAAGVRQSWAIACDRVLRDVIGEVVTFGEMLILETNSVG